ncbi:calmodulin-like protein [Plasmodium berghei]|uniref:Calmodulin n=2 Tax=Plasmodium berghei TaxID=5821 RepID=A0A509ARW8_PLABA|nr:calmodulin-like protein [Plasmodium berghei ANKA]CXI89493.1 calmodulin-like protein [Plasmodium berghei]SCL96076.1 calmodulin-like protein [Plasmodium berghei]SCM16357.1 calmodulin-like protein [Plasmodium berghei]SCM18151.1 calmodulin-like protein [Plasmodium berghei]SCN27578.1 calmodulin-like protein [Plasmodium berghei]|eukprot:XP_034423234.1 calmodulin-like protein [Plasmodium berghei ANKA]
MDEKPYIPIIEKLNNEKNPNFYICGNGYIAPLDIKNLKKISNTEKKNLQRVFKMMDKDNTGKISSCNLHDILHKYNYKISKSEVERMIWEFDENMDNCLDYDEIYFLYLRCVNDKKKQIPSDLYNIIQFFMFDYEMNGYITVEKTLQILYVRFGREKMDLEVQDIFGDKYEDKSGVEKQICLKEYLDNEKNRIQKYRNENHKKAGKV